MHLSIRLVFIERVYQVIVKKNLTHPLVIQSHQFVREFAFASPPALAEDAPLTGRLLLFILAVRLGVRHELTPDELFEGEKAVPLVDAVTPVFARPFGVGRIVLLLPLRLLLLLPLLLLGMVELILALASRLSSRSFPRVRSHQDVVASIRPVTCWPTLQGLNPRIPFTG